MRRFASTSPCAACRRAQVDLAISSVFTDAIWMRQPPVGPDIFSIRLAMLGPVSVGVVVGAWVTVGWLAGNGGVDAAGGGVEPLAGAGLAVADVDAVPPLPSPSTGLVDRGTWPFAGSWGVVGP